MIGEIRLVYKVFYDGELPPMLSDLGGIEPTMVKKIGDPVILGLGKGRHLNKLSSVWIDASVRAGEELSDQISFLNDLFLDNRAIFENLGIKYCSELSVIVYVFSRRDGTYDFPGIDFEPEFLSLLSNQNTRIDVDGYVVPAECRRLLRLYTGGATRPSH